MEIGIIVSDPRALTWPSRKLREAIVKRGILCRVMGANFFKSSISRGCSQVFYRDLPLVGRISGAILRSFGGGSCDQLTYKISVLEHMEMSGIVLMNGAYPTRRAKDKYSALVYLSMNSIPVPKTVVSFDYDRLIQDFDRFGEVVVKPLIGSRGLGSVRINDPDTFFRMMRFLKRINGVAYLQEYVSKPMRDIRVMVVGDQAVCGMYRVVKDEKKWKTNIYLGAKPEPLKLNDELAELSVRASRALGLDYSGVDIIEGKDGYLVIEVNATPSWRGLQKVSKIDISDLIVSHLIEKIKG
ncbi:MAG: RimK family alpha-L-glutamate ligase [Candidatus Asgardarchaeia archaeon]